MRKQKFIKELAKYDYDLPEELITKEPARPRDAARLLIYNRRTKRASFDVFKNIGKHLPSRAVLVFNQTKVLPARLVLKKETGGLVKVLYLGNNQNFIRVLSNRPLKIGARLFLKNYSFAVHGRDGEAVILEPSFSASRITQVLEKYGETPIPPYIKNSPLKEKDLRKEYQTVFAKIRGSVAAPTASLHFTKKLMASLRKNGFAIKFVTLHVNLGTFATLTAARIKTGKLHKEEYFIGATTADFLNRARKEGRPIVAVGTTALRALEAASNSRGRLARLRGETDLFIREGYKFKFAEGLITNFHVPRSSLMMLVAALIGHKKLLQLYHLAIKNKFRFFSFGDGMMIT